MVPPLNSQGLCFTPLLAFPSLSWSYFPENSFSPHPYLHAHVPSLGKGKVQVQARSRSSGFIPGWAQTIRWSITLAELWEEAQKEETSHHTATATQGKVCTLPSARGGEKHHWRIVWILLGASQTSKDLTQRFWPWLHTGIHDQCFSAQGLTQHCVKALQAENWTAMEPQRRLRLLCEGKPCGLELSPP